MDTVNRVLFCLVRVPVSPSSVTNVDVLTVTMLLAFSRTFLAIKVCYV